MNLKFYPGDLHRAARLVSADGEILAEFGVDPEFGVIKLYVDCDGTQKAEILLDLAVGSPAPIVDADEKAMRALPAAPRIVIEHTFPVTQAVNWDYEPNDYASLIRDEEDDEDDEDIMEGLCICCAQELCLQCQRCHTPACEEETEPTDDCGT